MIAPLDEVPDWTFEIDEVSMGVYQIRGKHTLGWTIEITGTSERTSSPTRGKLPRKWRFATVSRSWQPKSPPYPTRRGTLVVPRIAAVTAIISLPPPWSLSGYSREPWRQLNNWLPTNGDHSDWISLMGKLVRVLRRHLHASRVHRTPLTERFDNRAQA
jgi:hypothetical protein